MDKSLAGMVKTTTKFEHTDKHFTPEQQELMRRKEVYPYDYMPDFSKLAETEPPQREAFRELKLQDGNGTATASNTMKLK